MSELDGIKAKGFEIQIQDKTLLILIARQEDAIYGYINACPHTGINLDWVKDQFLDHESKYLQCATHGALFQIHDGYCVFGPCRSESLQQLELVEKDEHLYVIPPAKA